MAPIQSMSTMISGIKGHSDLSVANAVGFSKISPRMAYEGQKVEEDTLRDDKQGMIYRRGTSVTVNDLEKELSSLLPNDDYLDAFGDTKLKIKKRTNRGSNIGLKTANRIDIEKANREQPPTNLTSIEE